LFKSRPGGGIDPRVAVGAGGRVTSEAVKTVPSATAVGKALTTSVKVLDDVDEEDDTAEEEEEEDVRTLGGEELEAMTIGLTLLLIEGTGGFDEGVTGLDEDTVGLTELLMILLELEAFEGETVGFGTEEVEIFDEVETCLVDEDVEVFLVEEAEEIFLVVDEIWVDFAVDLTELVTRAGVAVTALQTWDTTGAGSAAKGLPLRVGLRDSQKHVKRSFARFRETYALNQNLQKGRG
jgi:hypothetical protein